MESGASVISATIGAAMMLISLLVATHVIVSLHQRSVVRAVAVRAVVNASRVGGSERESLASVRSSLGSGTDASFRIDGDDLVIRVLFRTRTFLRHGPLARLGNIRVEARARREGFRGG